MHFLLILKGGSDGSVLLTAILHGATDATIAYSNVMTGDLRLLWIFVVVQLLFALALVFTQGAEHLSHKADLRGITYEGTSQVTL